MIVLSVGANNSNHLVEYDKLKAYLAGTGLDYSMIQGWGRFEGVEEESATLYFSGMSLSEGRHLAQSLARILNQKSIGLHQLPDMEFVGQEDKISLAA